MLRSRHPGSSSDAGLPPGHETEVQVRSQVSCGNYQPPKGPQHPFLLSAPPELFFAPDLAQAAPPWRGAKAALWDYWPQANGCAAAR